MSPSSRTVSVLVHSGVLAVQALFCAPVVLLGAWLALLGTERWRNDEHWRHFPPSFGCDDRVLLDRCTLRQLLFTWACPAVLALAALGLLVLRPLLQQQHSQPHGGGHMQRLGARLIPPRAFWLWWCGGLSVADLAAVGAWAAINVAWLAAILSRYLSLLPIFSRGGSSPLWLLKLELLAVALGSLLFPNLLLLFFPISRGSVVLAAARVSYPDAIRYHRWLGHAVMTIVTAHSLAFWGVWTWQGVWLKEATDQGSRVNNLAGGASFLGGLALWLSSLEAARRASYTTFYALHHVGFWVFMAAGCAHYSGMFWYFVPGLLLYGVDATLRLHQAIWERSAGGGGGDAGAKAGGGSGGSGLLLAHAAVSPGGGLASLLVVPQRYGVAPTGFVWLAVPEISPAVWHPFEYIAVPGTAAAAAGAGANADCHGNTSSSSSSSSSRPTTGLLIHIKAYDRWTRELVALVARRGAAFTLKAEGPYAELPGAVLGHGEVDRLAATVAAGQQSGKHQHGGSVDGLVIVAGGVGATAALSVFQELATSGAATAGLPLLLIWCCRRPDELEFLAPRVFAMANALQLAMSVHLFCTGLPAAPVASSQLAPGGGESRPPAPAAAAGAAGGASGESALLVTTSLCPVVALRSFWCQAAHKLLLHVVVFAGALAAILLVRYASVVAASQPWSTAATGLAYIAAISAGILLPGSAVLWLALAAQRAQQRRCDGSSGGAPGEAAARAGDELRAPLLDGTEAGGSSAALPVCRSAAAAAAAAAMASAQLLPAAASGQWQLQLPAPGGGAYAVQQGRPPLQPLLAAWLAAQGQLPAKQAPQGHRRYTVAAMGPTRLVADVALLCDNINCARGGSGCGDSAGVAGVTLEFVQKTHEL